MILIEDIVIVFGIGPDACDARHTIGGLAIPGDQHLDLAGRFFTDTNYIRSCFTPPHHKVGLSLLTPGLESCHSWNTPKMPTGVFMLQTVNHSSSIVFSEFFNHCMFQQT